MQYQFCRHLAFVESRMCQFISLDLPTLETSFACGADQIRFFAMFLQIVEELDCRLCEEMYWLSIMLLGYALLTSMCHCTGPISFNIKAVVF